MSRVENMAKQAAKKKGRGTAIFLYVVAVIMVLIFIYTLFENVMYIITYAASYGIEVSDMLAEAIKYVVTGSVSYLVYAVIVFAAAKILSLLSEVYAATYSGGEINKPKGGELDFGDDDRDGESFSDDFEDYAGTKDITAEAIENYEEAEMAACDSCSVEPEQLQAEAAEEMDIISDFGNVHEKTSVRRRRKYIK